MWKNIGRKDRRKKGVMKGSKGGSDERREDKRKETSSLINLWPPPISC